MDKCKWKNCSSKEMQSVKETITRNEKNSAKKMFLKPKIYARKSNVYEKNVQTVVRFAGDTQEQILINESSFLTLLQDKPKLNWMRPIPGL